MEALSMVMQEGQPTLPMTPPAKMTFSVTAGTDTDRDEREPLKNTGVNAMTQENEICGNKWCCQTAETKQCSSLNQNTGNSYSLPTGQVCTPHDNDVKMGSTPDLLKSTLESSNKNGTSVIEKSQDRRKVDSNSEHDMNGCYQFRCPSAEDNHDPFALDVQMVNSNGVETAAPSNIATASREHCTSPCPPLVPFSQSSITSPKPLPVPSSSNGGAERPRIIKHKPSSITFADYDCASGLSRGVHESSDCGESSSEEDSDDDVFTEMIQIREIHPGCRHRRAGRRKGTGKGKGEEPNGDGELESAIGFSSSTGYEAEEENSSREESPLVLLSPWSESMNQLMKRLDRLNLDIEEALSASSSPSDTPCTTRRQPINDKASHQNTTACGTEGNQTLDNKRTARGPSWKECHGQDIFLPNSSSVTRARPRKTEMSAKRRHGGAVTSRCCLQAKHSTANPT